MNKNIYRVIFSAVRGVWTVVQETATGRAKGRTMGTPGRAAAVARAGGIDLLAMRHIAFAALCTLGMQPMAVDAQVVAAPGAAGSKPIVGVTANGLPIVQISTPNAAGVSNNNYTQYNVGPQGLILNNSQGNVLTQQAGYVGGNPNLSSGTARVIINQVVGGNASQLLGYTEVAGARAEVVIANPAGIFCNGCGFINTSRGILTTGTPVFGGTGSLDAFHVTGGQIQIGSAGLNGSNVDQVDLIARSVAINGKVWAGQALNVVAGNNDVRHSDLSAQSLGADGNAPGVAIDVAQLGGMYAGKIQLVGTEAGVGVNSAGTIAAQTGDLLLSSQGKVTLSGTTSASGNVTVSAAGDLSNTGSVYAKQNAAVGSGGQLTNGGTVAALGNTTVTGAGIASTGALGAGIDSNGNVTGAGSLTVTGSGTVSATGQLLAGGDLAVSGSSLGMAQAQTLAKGNALLNATGAGGDTGNIDATRGTLQAGGGLTVSAAGALTNDHGAMSAAQIGVTADSVSNRSGTLSQTGSGATTIRTTNGFDNSGGTFATNAQAATLRTGSLTNAGGQITHAGTGAFSVVTGVLDNSAGSVATNGQATITAARIADASGSITSGRALTVTSTGDIDNTAGRLEAGGAVTVSAANVQNAAGRIVSQSADGLSLSATGQITNVAGTTAQGVAGGVIGGNGDATIHAAALTNSGTVTAARNLGVAATGAIDNSNGSLSGATLSTQSASLKNANGGIGASTVSITAPQLDNSSGQITANQLSVAATNLTNAHGTLTQLGTGAIALGVSGTLDNSNSGVIQTNSTDLTLGPATLNNNGGTITHAGTGTLTMNAGNGSGALTNVGGSIASNGRTLLTAGSVDNTGGKIGSQADLVATVAGAVTNTNGRLTSNTNLGVASGAALTNVGGTIAATGNNSVQAASLTNGGSITAGQTLTAVAIGTLDNGNGTLSAQTVTTRAASFKNAGGLVSGNAVSMAVPQLENSSGRIIGNQIDLTATNLTNEHGTLTQLGTGAMGLGVSGALENTNGGVIQTNSTDLTIASATFDNSGGTITHAGTGTLTIAPGAGAAALTNVGGRIVSNGQATVTVGSLDNTGGVLASQGLMSAIVRGVLNNTNGRLSSGTGLSATASGALLNTGGVIGAGGAVAGSTLSLTAASLNNANGVITNGGTGATTINGGSQIVNSNAGGVSGMGAISGNGSVTLSATSVSNTQGGQLSGANLQINAGTLDNSGGAIGNIANATGDVGITASTLTNALGTVNASHNLSVTTNTLAGGGAYSAVNDLTLNLQGSFATSSAYTFKAGGNLTFTLPGTFSNGGTLMAVNGLTINAGDIGNSGTLAAGGLLTTHSNTLTNVGSIVGGSVSLNASQIIQNLGTSALIGATDSTGKLELLSADIENRDDSTASDTPAMTAIYGLGRVILAGGKDANGNYTNASLVRNQSALIQSGGDMTLAANQVINTRRSVSTSGFTSSVDPNLLASLGISLSGRTGQVGVMDPNSIGGVYTDPPHGGQWNSTYQYTTYTGTAIASTITSISPEAQIIAGGNLNASSVGTFQDHWSKVTAAGNIASPANLDQNSWQGQNAPQVQVTYSGEYHYNNYDNSEYNWQLPFGDAGFVTGRPGGYTQAAPADVRTYALPGYESSFTAGGTISGTGVTINNTAGNAGVTPLGLLPGQSVSGTGAGSVTGTIAAGGAVQAVPLAIHGGQLHSGGLPNSNNPIIAGAVAITVLNNLTLPKGGLFSVDSAPNAPYLIETNPAFTNQQRWLSSDYYFQQMGMNPGQLQRRLGDGFYEQKLVQDQIMSMTGRSVLTNYASTQDEFQSFMTSGAQLAKSLNLAPGTGLSPEQVSQLTSNVVIMQSEVVGGQTVLVPVVYLAKASQENMGNGPVIAATNIDLQNAKTVTNSGTIAATNNFSISGQSIDSSFGTLQAGGQMSLVTAGDVNLTSAKVNAGSLALEAGGNLILDTAAKTLNQVSDTGASRVTTTLGPMASINVTGNAAIVTGGNFEQNAGALNVGGALGMSIGGNWTLGVQETGETKIVARANGVSDTHLVSDTGSSVKVGGKSSIAVGGDLTATGANINLGGGGTIAAAGNVTLQAAVATSTVDSNSSGSDHHGSYAETLHTTDDKITGTTLKSGDSVAIVSGKDLNLLGSTVTLDKGSAVLMATGSVNVGAVDETHTSNTWETHRHGGFASHASGTNRVDQTTTTADGSTISADSVSVISGKDINVTGSSIVGTNDVGLAAKGNVNILAATDTWQDSEYHQEKHSGLSGSGGIGVSFGSSERSDRYDGSAVTQSQSRSTVGSVQGNLTISAGQDVHIGGSDVVAGKAAGDVTGATGNINIAGQNVTIDPGLDNEKSHEQQASRSSGFTMALTGTPLDTVRNMRANASSGNGFQRAQAVGNELGAGALSAPSVSLSYGSSKSSSTSDSSSMTYSGSTIRGGGNVSVIATGGAVKDAKGNAIDGDLSVIGSTISAGGTTTLAANRNVTLQASTDQLLQSMQSSSSSTGFQLASPSLGDLGRWVGGTANTGGTSPSPYNASRSSSNGVQTATTQTATVVTGNSVLVKSVTGDINVVGSGIVGTQGVDLVASQGAINVLAGLETSTNHQESSSKQIGSLGSNGTATGFSVGVASTHSVEDTAAQTQSKMRSQIVSGSGNVTLDAKQDVTVAGSDLSAGKDLTLIGKNLNLDPGTDATQSSMRQDSSQYGVSLALGGAIGNAVAAVNQSMAHGSRGGDARLGALDKAQAGLVVYNAYQVASSMSSGSPTGQPLIKVTVSIGGGTSHTDSQSSSLANDGSALHAGGDVNLVATGSGAKDASGFATDGDINARGTQISGQNVTLNAARDINLISAQDTSQLTSHNSSSSGSIGVGLGLGGQQNGFTIELAASTAHGNANGQSVTNRDTQVSASNTLTMTSGRDTNLRGAEAAGSVVDANVGRDLNIQSQQDTSTYDSKQSSGGFQASFCIPPICYGQTVSASGSVSEQNIKSSFQSVNQQSGIYAGAGGFDVHVGNHTQLDGGVIASTAGADKNSLSTQTFGYTNLENHASYSGDTIGFSASGGYGWSSPSGNMVSTPISSISNKLPGPQNSQGLGPTGFSAAGTSSDVTGTTYAAVSAGSITVRGDAGSGRDSTAGLSRDTASANGAVRNGFDAQKVQNDMAIQQGVGQVGMQVVGDVATVLENQAHAKYDAASEAYKQAEAAHDTEGMAQAQADETAAAQQAALWGNDGALRMGAHAIVSGIGAAMGGGSVAGAVAGTVAGDLAGAAVSHGMGDDSAAGKLLSNVAAGLAGAVVGGAVGGSSGAVSGAGSALNADLYNRQLHPEERTLIANKARQIATKQAQNGADATKIEEYWTNMMTLVANADVDAQARQQLAQDVTQMGQAAQSSGNVQAFQKFLADLDTAQQYIKGMAGQTIVSGGTPIVADDGLLKTFQATGSQYKDSSLFGTPGGTKLGLAIGETPASAGISSQYYIAPNGPTNQQLAAFSHDIIEQTATPNGSAIPLYPLEDAALGWAGGKIVSGVLGKIFGGAAGDTMQTASTGPVSAPATNASGDLSLAGNAARNQPYGNGVSASPAPGTSVAGSSGANVRLPAAADSEGLGGTGQSLPPSYALSAPQSGSVIRNAMSDAEVAQAQDIVNFKGGTFKGAPTSNYPGIDGWLNDVPVQLKVVTGQSMSAIQRNIVGAASDMSKAGYVGDVYIDATRTGVSMDAVTQFVKPGTPISNILSEGTVNSVNIKTGQGWITLTRTTLARPPN